MSLKEVELAIKALTIALQTFQPHQGPYQDPSNSSDTDSAKFILQDQDLLDDDIEIVESYTSSVDASPHQRIADEVVPSHKPQVKSIKPEKGDKKVKPGQEAVYRKAAKGGERKRSRPEAVVEGGSEACNDRERNPCEPGDDPGTPQEH